MMKTSEKFSRSTTAKVLVIAALTLLMLIPVAMVREMIRERQGRSIETIEKINTKWSGSQRLSGPVLTIPYTTQERRSANQVETVSWTFNVVPDRLEIDVRLSPEERYFGIYKTILYKSVVEISGEFDGADLAKLPAGTVDSRNIAIRLGLSDLRGVGTDPKFTLNGVPLAMEASGVSDRLLGAVLEARIANPAMIQSNGKMAFTCSLELKGSSYMNFVPMGKSTRVSVAGAWPNPGFTGVFTPEYSLSEQGFTAEWSVLKFNRNIPDTWIDDNIESLYETYFGVNLVNPVDHYQQSERSAKYALMFIALTFVVFFFVEVITRRRIHPIQYLLVGIALVLFYSLLLSISERLGFAWAYLIAGIATIGLITAYAASIFKTRKPTIILALVLIFLYTFLYMILQLEDAAFLIGSIGLFLILAVIMYLSRRINWYKSDSDDEPTPPTHCPDDHSTVPAAKRTISDASPTAVPVARSVGSETPPPVSERISTPPPAPRQVAPPTVRRSTSPAPAAKRNPKANGAKKQTAAAPKTEKQE